MSYFDASLESWCPKKTFCVPAACCCCLLLLLAAARIRCSPWTIKWVVKPPLGRPNLVKMGCKTSTGRPSLLTTYLSNVRLSATEECTAGAHTCAPLYRATLRLHAHAPACSAQGCIAAAHTSHTSASVQRAWLWLHAPACSCARVYNLHGTHMHLRFGVQGTVAAAGTYALVHVGALPLQAPVLWCTGCIVAMCTCAAVHSAAT